MGVYGILDLYINPKRSGGGFSGAMALAAGVPVITLPDCDVAYNVGEEFTVDGYPSMVDTVCRYIEDSEFYAEKQKTAEKIAEQNSDDKMIAYVKKTIDGIMQCMEVREDKE